MYCFTSIAPEIFQKPNTRRIKWQARRKFSRLVAALGVTSQNVNQLDRLLFRESRRTFAAPDDGNFADNVFLYVFQKIRLRYNVLFITQDNGLARDATDIFKDSRSVKGVKKISVRKIGKNGFLKNFSADVPKKIPSSERFDFADKVVNLEGNLPVSTVPKVGDFVTAIRNGETQQIRLLEEVGSGGEGSVYKTDFDGYVAKIYKPEKITRLRHEKLKLMLSKDIDCDGVCFPRALLNNRRNEFVGYMMKTASGRDLFKSVFVPMLLKKYFPQWNKIDTVQPFDLQAQGSILRNFLARRKISRRKKSSRRGFLAQSV